MHPAALALQLHADHVAPAADQAFVANWTIYSANRTVHDDPSSQVVPIIASIAATCTDGTALPPVAVPVLSKEFDNAYNAAVSYTTSSPAVFAQQWGSQPYNWGSINAGGFIAVWPT